MTVDELIDLAEGLLEEIDFSTDSLRSGHAKLQTLSDEQFLLAVRFVAGERPTASERRRTGAEEYLDDRVRGPRRERKLVSLSEDEWADRLAEIEELDEETPYTGPVDIGDGVTLGL